MVHVPDITSNLVQLQDGVWTSPSVSKVSFPDTAPSNALKFQHHSLWVKHRVNCLVQVLKQYPPPGPLYDVGGGNGLLAAAFQNAGFEAVVVEPLLESARNARSRGLQVICSTLQEVGFQAHTLPALGMFDVLEHIDEDLDVLKYLRSLLRMDGRLFLTVPAYRFLWSTTDDHAGHKRRYTEGELKRKLGRAGFRLEYATYLFSFYVLPMFFLRTVPTILGLRRKHKPEINVREHLATSGALAPLIQWFGKREMGRIKTHRRIPFGSSCLIVARPG